MGHGGPSKGEGHLGYDGFAVTKTPYNHVVEKYVFYQRVNCYFYENMKYHNNNYALFEQHQTPALYLEKDGPSPFFAIHICFWIS